MLSVFTTLTAGSPPSALLLATTRSPLSTIPCTSAVTSRLADPSTAAYTARSISTFPRRGVASTHSADQSDGSSSPISHTPASLHGPAFPSRSHAITFHQHRRRDSSAFPAYSTCTLSALATFPLSQRSPSSRASTASSDATSTRYA